MDERNRISEERKKEMFLEEASHVVAIDWHGQNVPTRFYTLLHRLAGDNAVAMHFQAGGIACKGKAAADVVAGLAWNTIGDMLKENDGGRRPSVIVSKIEHVYFG